jgi:tryptophan-rich sensory protein
VNANVTLPEWVTHNLHLLIHWHAIWLAIAGTAVAVWAWLRGKDNE